MPTSTTHVFRASLKPKLYRDIEIEGGKSLANLAEAIVTAFDFEFDHPFGFYSNLKDPYRGAGERYELFADMEGQESDAKSVEKTKIAEVFKTTGKKMLFLFDYGEEWRFQVELRALGKKAPNARYPRLLSSAGDAPSQYGDDEDE
jgi:hypothetical protein